MGFQKGRAKTGGRMPGVGNRGPTQRKLLAEAQASGEAPLDFLLRLMRNPKLPLELRLAAARAAAPFCHRALKAVEHSGTSGPAQIIVTWAE